nr:MAG TPA: Melon necrotic spot virus P7B protein [Bacteriophage sp.]
MLHYILLIISAIFFIIALFTLITSIRFLKNKEFKEEMNSSLKYQKYGKMTNNEVIEYGSIAVCLFLFLSYLFYRFAG